MALGAMRRSQAGANCLLLFIYIALAEVCRWQSIFGL
jgi:hypothetical protein